MPRKRKEPFPRLLTERKLNTYFTDSICINAINFYNQVRQSMGSGTTMRHDVNLRYFSKSSACFAVYFPPAVATLVLGADDGSKQACGAGGEKRGI